nr:GNAT family N-acetyltransferase [Kribbella sandramycini]
MTELLHDAYAELGRRGLNFTAVDQNDDTTLRRASSGNCFVLEQDGALLATITISMPPEPALAELTEHARTPNRAWLSQLAVAPAHQGTGIGTHLWAIGRRTAADLSATTIGVDTAEPATELIRLYQRWGFAQVDSIQWPGKTYRSVVMALTLA